MHPSPRSSMIRATITCAPLSSRAARRRKRAPTLTTSTNSVISSAPAHASECHASYGRQGELEDDDGNVRHRIGEIGGEILIVECGEEQRGGLPADAGDAEQETGHNPGLRGRIEHLHDHLPLRRAERERGFAQGHRNKPQGLVGCPHDDGQQNERKGDRPRPAGEMPALTHDEFVDKQADHDGRRRQQNVVHEANHLGERALACRIRRGACRQGCRSDAPSSTATAIMTPLP